MISSKTRLRTVWPSGVAQLLSLLFGGIPFSVLLFLRLGIDIESPELLRYVLIASPFLIVLLVSVVLVWTPTEARKRFSDAVWLSTIVCIPCEAIAYVVSSWGLRGWQVFAANNLPLLLLLLLVWAMFVGILSAGIASLLRMLFPEKMRRWSRVALIQDGTDVHP